VTSYADQYRHERAHLNGDAGASTPDLGRVDLGTVVRGDTPTVTAGLVYRDDGEGLLYPGALHDLHSEPSHGKTWFSLLAGRDVLYGGGGLVVLDYEGTAPTFVERLRLLGVDDELIADEQRVAYHNLTGRTSEQQVAALRDEVASLRAGLVVVDAMLPALVRNGLDDNSNADLATFYESFVRPLTTTGAAVLCVDHMTKDAATRGRGARGAGAKLQLVDVSYSVRLVKPFSRDRAGSFKIVCAKDRFGTFAIGETVADVQVARRDAGVMLELRTPERHDPDAPFRPTRIMEYLSRALEDHGELNTRALRVASRGDDKVKPLAIELLVNEGYIERHAKGQQVLYRSVRPYRDGDEP
jgi:hypothetical protein